MSALKTRKQIIARIKALHRKHKPLNVAAVKRHCPALIEAVYAIKPYWGWKQALEDAGISYDEIEVQLNEFCVCRVCGENARNLVKHIWSVHQFEPGEYRENYPDAEILSEQIRAQRFGFSRNKGAEAVVPIPHWEPIMSPEYLLDRLNEYQKIGLPLNLAAAFQYDKGISNQAKKYFGSWDRAIEALGLDPSEVRKQAARDPNIRETIIEALRRHIDERGTTHGFYQEQTRLSYMANNIFGSMRNAVSAAGFNPDEVMQYVYDKRFRSELLEKLKRLGKRKGSDRYDRVAGFRKRYKRAARVFFNGWENAAKAAKVPAWKISRVRMSSPEAVWEFINERIENGQSLKYTAVKEDDKQLLLGIREHLGGYRQFNEMLKRKGYVDPDDEKRAQREAQVKQLGTESLQSKRTWDLMMKKVGEFHQEHGVAGARLIRKYPDEIALWIRFVRRHLSLLDDRQWNDMMKLQLLTEAESKWFQWFQRLEAYIAEHGDPHVPREWSVDSGLARWVDTQRERHKAKTIEHWRKDMLDSVGFRWRQRSIKHQSFDFHFEELVAYQKAFGDCNVPAKYEPNRPLGSWVSSIRLGNYQITPKQRRRLDAIGFTWDPKGDAWEVKFNELKAFKKEHGHCLVTTSLNKSLAIWAVNTRKRRAVQSQDKIDRLNEIGFDWNPDENAWDAKYAELREFHRQFGHFNIPRSKNDDTYKFLSTWATKQRSCYREGNLSERRTRKLNQIGFVWEPKQAVWDQRIAELKDYKERFGDCRVPSKDFAENPALGNWCSNLRQKWNNLEPEKQEQLLAIGFEPVAEWAKFKGHDFESRRPQPAKKASS